MMIQDYFKSLGDYGCLAICYAIASMNGDTDYNGVFERLNEAKDNGAFDDECYVSNPLAFPGIKDVKKVSSLEKCKGYYAAVNFVYGKKNHFVLYVKSGENSYSPYYNTLENSNCVKYGRVQDVRDIYLEG